MAAPSKRTAKKTTASRRRSSSKSGRGSTSFVAMGMIAGLAIAILFYTIFIREDAKLTTNNAPRYTHTPNQSNVLNPLPPKQKAEIQTQTQPSITESQTKQEKDVKSAVIPKQATPPKVISKPSEKPNLGEDTIGKLIAEKEKKSKASNKDAQKPNTKTKDDADHVGALIKTIPSSNTDSDDDKIKGIITKQNNNVNAVVADKAIALNPAPSKERPFYLQAGPYKNENEADTMRAQLLLLGYNTANVHKALVNNKTVYGVRVGPYNSSTEFEKAQKNLEAAKLKLNPIH